MTPYIGESDRNVPRNDAARAVLNALDFAPLKTVGKLAVDSETRYMFHLLHSGLNSNRGEDDGADSKTYRKLIDVLTNFNLDALTPNSQLQKTIPGFSLVVQRLFDGGSAKRSLWTMSPDYWAERGRYRLTKREMTGRPEKPNVSEITEDYAVVLEGPGRAIYRIK